MIEPRSDRYVALPPSAEAQAPMRSEIATARLDGSEEATTATRPLRILGGEGMVTPVRPLEWTADDGTREVLLRGRHRFAPDHRVVQARPELFTLCVGDDRTRAPLVFRRVLERARAELEAEFEGRHLATYEPSGGERWRL